jgi:outer membrane protein assembly factor BamB
MDVELGDGGGERSRIGLRRAAALLVALVSLPLAGPLASTATAEPSWPTYHHDPGRSGADPEAYKPIEPKLAWQSQDLGAPMWSQPLVLGSRVYAATVGDQIYALDATTGKVEWQTSAGVPVPEKNVVCGDIEPTVGVVGTPVIDTATHTLYAVADTWEASTKTIHHVLEGFDVNSGERVLTSQVDPPGAEPKTLLERPALNLANGNVIFGFGGNAGDCGEYRGAVVAAPENGGAPSFWKYAPASPAFGGAAVWGTSGPAVDGGGNIYASTGNPNFPAGQEVTTYDHSDSVIELSSSMSLTGTFEPATWLSDSNHDRDMGSAGPELLPGGLLFQAGKNETGYLIDEATMGSGAPPVYSGKVCKGKTEGNGEGSFGGDAYAAGTIYVPCIDGVRALTYNQTARTFSPLWHGPADAMGPPIVSGGLVWVLSGKFLTGGGTKLYGLDPATGIPRYTLTLPSPVVDHFGSPSAAGGRVFVATGSTVTAYQIADLSPALVTEAPTSVGQTTATLNATVNPRGWTVSECRFEYGPTETYGASVPCASLPGGGESPVAVSVHISGLQANTTYHFRVVAINPGGTSYGSDETLLTASSPLVVPIAGTSSSQGSVAAGTGASANGVSAFTEHVPPAPVASLLSRSLTASRSGTVKVKLGCKGQSSCVGTVTLRTLSPVPTGGTSRGTGVLALAAGSFDLAGGRDGSIAMHLSAKARKLLQRMHTLRVRAGIAWHAPAGSAHTRQIILTLRLARNAR